MNEILNGVALVLGLLAFIGLVICILMLPVEGYFFVRALLKIMRIYSGSPVLAGNELKLAKICGTVVLVTGTSWVLTYLIWWYTGFLDQM